MKRLIFSCAAMLSLVALHTSAAAPADTLDARCKVRLPETVNRITPVVMPLLSPDGSRLYFDRKNYLENSGGLQDPDDVWFSDRLPNGSWAEPENLRAINSTGSDVMFSIAKDGNTALVYNGDLVAQGCGFGISRRAGGEWQKPTRLVIENYYNFSGYFFGNLSAGGRTLLLALERREGRGGLDLYVSFLRSADSSWSAPLNLGATLNSAADEYSPFLAADGKSLYFASRGHGGLGGFDVFVSRRLDDSWTKWSAPLNLGAGVNTTGNDHSFTLTPTGDSVLLISTDADHPREGIYVVCLPPALRPGKPAPDHVLAPAQNDTLLLFPVYFGRGSSELSQREIDNIRRNAPQTGAHAITLNGYTCDLGDAQFNKRLAARRIAAVEKLLGKTGKRSRNPIGENELNGKILTDDERTAQRRVDVIVMRGK